MSYTPPNAFVIFSIACNCARSSPSCLCTRISTSRSLPKLWMEISPKPRFSRSPRTPPISAGVSDCASIKIPPLKSIPRFNPTIKNNPIETSTAAIDDTPETGIYFKKFKDGVEDTSFNLNITNLPNPKVPAFSAA